MTTRHRPVGLFCCWILSLALLSPAVLKAQSGDLSADLNAKVDALQKRIESLQKELANVKEQLNEPKPASPAASIAAASTPSAPSAAEQAATAAVPAATAQAATTPATPAAPTMASILGPLSITGFVDGYYGYNFEHPHLNAPSVLAGSPSTGNSGLRAFDSPYEQLSLNAIELIMDKPPDATNSRIGYHVALGFGNAMNVVGSTDPGGLGFAQYLKEAYGSYLAPVGKGLEIDFGKYVTPMGFELIESKDNWNYSRGLLFTYAIPFYHFGLRTKYTFNDKVSVSAGLVNGWNNIVDNNTGKTGWLSLTLTPNKKFSLVQNYMIGPEMAGTNKHFRQLTDTTATYSPTSKLSLALNYDYGRGDMPVGFLNPVWWSGVAGYVRYQFNDKYAWSQRYEYYDDKFGFTTGTGQHINEFTETFERKVAGNLITRLEYRRDMTSQPSLFKGTTPVDHQDTIEAGLIYMFDLKELR